MKTFAAYPEYRSSDVRWLGDVPAHWEVNRLRFVTRVNPSKTEVRKFPSNTEVSFLPMELIGEDGGLTLTETRQLYQVTQGFTYFRDGDVVVAKITPCFENGKGAACAGLVNGIGFGTTELHVLRPTARMDTRFLFHITRSEAFRTFGARTMYGSAGQQRVSEDFVRDFTIPLPTVDEQRAIAKFLDRETGKLDALVQKKERLIATLQEKRTALISHAVTKGLNPAASMKDSGIPWLGKIPAHWQAKRLKFLLNRIEQGWSPQCDNQPAEAGKWGVLKTGCVNGGVFNAAENKALPNGMEPPLEYEVRPGDVLMSRASGSAELVGSVAMVTERPFARLLLSDKTYRLPVRPQQMDAQLLVWAMGSPMVRHQIAGFISGAEGLANNITQGDIRRIVLAVAPLAEQRDIIQRVRTETTKLDALIAKVRTGIERLQEYRTALISAAVTGKIDVRQPQPSTSASVKLPPAAFRRAVFAAEVIHQLHDEPTFGHVKCQKILHLAEHHLGLPDFESNYFRQAAGPYDNQMMRSIDGQLERLKWFRAVKRGEAWHYDGLANAGQHEKYFGQFWGQHQDGLQKLLALLRKLDTERCEILSTLYAVWNDFLLAGASFDDAKLADEAIRWHPAKQRIERDRWLKALVWMREKGLVPRGTGKPTKVKK